MLETNLETKQFPEYTIQGGVCDWSAPSVETWSTNP